MTDAETILREHFKLVDHLQAVVNEANKHRPIEIPSVPSETLLNGATLSSVRRQGSSTGPIIACTLRAEDGTETTLSAIEQSAATLADDIEREGIRAVFDGMSMTDRKFYEDKIVYALRGRRT